MSIAGAMTSTSAQEIDVLDINGNGQIDQLEFLIGVEHYAARRDLRSVYVRDMRAKNPATTKDAGISQETSLIYAAEFTEKHQLPPLGPYRFDQLKPEWFELERVDLRKVRPDPRPGATHTRKRSFKIRRDIADLSAAPGTEKGALVSYGRYYSNDNAEQWLARGVVSLGYEFEPGDDAGRLGYWGFGGSLLTDRVSGEGGPEQETDLLQFRANIHAQFHPNESENSFLVSGSIINSTDWDFSHHRAGGSLDFEPIVPSIGLHGKPVLRFSPGGPGLQFTGRLVAHAEAGGVVDGELPPGTKGGEDYVRIGPFAELTVRPKGFGTLDKRIQGFASYFHYEDVAGDGGANRLFRTGLSYTLPLFSRGQFRSDDSKGSAGLSLEYRNGELPFSGKQDESLVIGFSLKF